MTVSCSATLTNSAGLKEQRREKRPIFSSGSRELVLVVLGKRSPTPDFQSNFILKQYTNTLSTSGKQTSPDVHIPSNS